MSEQRDTFSSKLGFILSAIGFAIGMGTFWRFPYLCGNNGGAIFLLLYIIAMVVIALPLFALEMSMGSKSKKDSVGAYKVLAPGKPWFLNGYLNVITMMLIVGTTLPIGGWVCVYILRAISGGVMGLSSTEIVTYYNANIVNNPVEVNLWVLGLIGIMMLILRHKLDKGLELANKICIPLLFLIMIALAIRSVTLEGAGPGLVFVFMPDFSKLTLDVVLLAVGQAFYAVGVAMAVSIVFGSYMQEKNKDIIKNTLTVGAGIISAAIFAGMIIFPSVFAFGLEPTAGPGLIFMTMPNIFNQLPGGQIIAIFFYILFLLAAGSTWLAGFESMIATMRDQYGFSRNKSVLVGAILITITALISANSEGALLLIDNVVGYTLTIGALVAAIFGGWFWGLDTFYSEARITNPSAQKAMSVLIKYIIPVVVSVLLLQVVLKF